MVVIIELLRLLHYTLLYQESSYEFEIDRTNLTYNEFKKQKIVVSNGYTDVLVMIIELLDFLQVTKLLKE